MFIDQTSSQSLKKVPRLCRKAKRRNSKVGVSGYVSATICFSCLGISAPTPLHGRFFGSIITIVAFFITYLSL